MGDVYDHKGIKTGEKLVCNLDDRPSINDWLQHSPQSDIEMGYLVTRGYDFQHQKYVIIQSVPSGSMTNYTVTPYTLMQYVVYFAVRHCIEATWLNDRDQFLYPNDEWQGDYEFQTDSLVYTLFHGQNRISSAQGSEVSNSAKYKCDVTNVASLSAQGSEVSNFAKYECDVKNVASQNHWIPFTEEEVGAQERFDSHLMSDYLRDARPTASDKEQMNPDSTDKQYTTLLANLRQAMKQLAAHIVPKVYQYGFLK